MPTNEEIRRGVIESLPEAKSIKDTELREQVYDAWTMALAESEYARIEDIPASGNPNEPMMRGGTQTDHLRSVARLSLAIAREMQDTFEAFSVDMDEAIAGGLCHDLGKPFEFGSKNQARWQADPRVTGWPSIRHPGYGVHIALSVGLPEKIAHICGAHSPEGEFVKRSLVGEIVHQADEIFWIILKAAGLLQG